MSEEQVSYRNVLQRYMDKKQEMNKDTMDTSYITNTQRTELKNFVIKLILGEEILNNINCFSNG